MAQRFDRSGVVDYARRYGVEAPKTQYELPGLTGEYHPGGMPVLVPPLWHAVHGLYLDRDRYRGHG